MTTIRLVRRVDRIAATRRGRTTWDAVETIAARLGMTPQEVMDEAYLLHEEARRLGITPVEVVANECGMSVAEVWGDIAHQHVLAKPRAVR